MPKFIIKKIETSNVSYSIDAINVEKAIRIAKSGSYPDGLAIDVVSATEATQYVVQPEQEKRSGVTIPASALAGRS